METNRATEMVSNGECLDKIILIGYEQLHLKNSRRRKGDKFGKGIGQIFQWIKLLLKIFTSNSRKLTW